MFKLFLILSLGLIPLILWGSYFYLKNPRKEDSLSVVKIFGLGMTSILPVLLFHTWLVGSVEKNLEKAWSIFEHPFLKAAFELGMLVLFIIAFASIFAIINQLIIAFSQQKNDARRIQKTSVYKKLYNLTPILALFVVLLGVDGISNIAFQKSVVLSIVGSIIVFAAVEEYFKYMINPFLVRTKIHSIGTAMVHALYVGLAFAFVENLLFFYVNSESENLQGILVFRTFFTTMLHIGASGILGYFYGMSLFSGSILTNYEIERGKYNLPFWLSAFFKKETIHQSVAVSRGFFIAALIHSIFNILLNFGMRLLAGGLVVVLTMGVIALLRSNACQVQYGLIGTTVMPEIDFQALRLKIAVLKEAKAIQAQKRFAISV